jgi:hypothetical protein
MVTGELPFRSNGPLDAWMKKIQNDLTPPRKVVPGLTERVEWAILRAMSADPNQRPRTCREFVEDLVGHSTRRVPTTDSSTPLQELWYLIYKDEAGVMHTVKGSTSAIRRSLKDGLLGDASNVRASRLKAGPFESLRDFPEFRDLVVTAAPLDVPPAPSGVTPTRASRPEPPQPEAPSAAPHIALGDEQDGGPAEWVKWAFLFALFVASAAVAFWLISLP